MRVWIESEFDRIRKYRFELVYGNKIAVLKLLWIQICTNEVVFITISIVCICCFQDPLKNGVLAVQTIRNNIMASTLLATTAITLSSLIGVFASNISETKLVYGNKTSLNSSIKRLSISLCFLVAFLCNMQSIRYYAHVSFLITTPAINGKKDFIEYVARTLNRGSYSWSLGLRAFYLSIPLVLWIYGPIPMFVCSCFTSFLLYFLDTTTQITRDLHNRSFREKESTNQEVDAAA